MSKKIKALVQKYEKDMQFENRFDDLKLKLDLIPDSEVKTEVFTIKRKVMPAYAMMVVLLMLVTGIIGLQFGLNNDFVDGPTTVDNVEFRLMTFLDIYERESAETVVLNDTLIAFIYVGYKDGEEKIVIRIRSKEQGYNIMGTINNIDVEQTDSDYYVVGSVIDGIADIDVQVVSNLNIIAELDIVLDLTQNFEYIGI